MPSLWKAAPQQIDVNVSSVLEVTAQQVVRYGTAVDHVQVEIRVHSSQV
jgi:hypothetical protein